MPFDASFDDVYDCIKAHVASATTSHAPDCSRLDEFKPAGRITDRLLRALTDCDIVIADVSETRPNVMWETGYAMALGKPVIVIAQRDSALPFDISDVQTIFYERNRLRTTLGTRLQEVFVDTVAAHTSTGRHSKDTEEARWRERVSSNVHVADLRGLVRDVVQILEQERGQRATESSPMSPRLRALAGSWISSQSGSHIHIMEKGGRLVAPYSYGGGEVMTGEYYDWREIGDHIFARFRWFDSDIHGFAFLREAGAGVLDGAWWYDSDVDTVADAPPPSGGYASTWARTREPLPSWATDFHQRSQSVKGGVRYQPGRKPQGKRAP